MSQLLSKNNKLQSAKSNEEKTKKFYINQNVMLLELQKTHEILFELFAMIYKNKTKYAQSHYAIVTIR